MAEQQQDLERSEPATPHKLEKAHERGSIVRSAELTFAAVLLGSVLCVHGLGTQALDAAALLVRRGLSLAAQPQLTQASALVLLETLAGQALRVIAPSIFVVWLVAVLSGALQARGVFTAQPLKPDFTRLSPATGLQRIFAVKSLHELWRSVAKLTVIAAAMTFWGRHHRHEILSLHSGSMRAMAQEGIALLGSALSLLTGLMLLFALLDWGINRREFMHKMRMSKREIKDEHKHREGDPRIKTRLRELRLAWLRRSRQLAKVGSADVLLTNPTHYAVALEYRHGEMPAPMITARGAGELAQRMRAEARRRAVPVVEHPPLARALFALDDAQLLVPEEHFTQVARILRWVYAARTGSGVQAANQVSP